MKTLTTTVARILYAVPFAVFGLMHFVNGPEMIGIVPAWLPGKTLMVYLTGLALFAAAVAILSGKLAKLASLLLALLLFSFVLFVHLPGIFSPETMQTAVLALLKDLALAGAALLISGTSKS